MTKGLYISHTTHLVREAQDALVEAAACLTLPIPERKAAALVLAGIAMLKIAESDPSEAAREKAVELVRSIRKKR
jgi:hypothetical protein